MAAAAARMDREALERELLALGLPSEDDFALRWEDEVRALDAAREESASVANRVVERRLQAWMREYSAASERIAAALTSKRNMTMKDTTFGPKGWTPDRLGSLKGKTYLITGTTAGAGFQATRILLSKGAKVVMLNRNADKSIAAVKTLKDAFGPNAEVSFVRMDLSDLASVRAAAEEKVRGGEVAVEQHVRALPQALELRPPGARREARLEADDMYGGERKQ